MHSFFYYLCTIKLKKCMAKNLLNKYVWLEMTYQSFVHDEANYLRSLTLHTSQKEIKRNDEYSIFTVRLRPTFDFRQEILTMGSDIEVLAPKWFRDEVAEISKHMWDKYNQNV